MSVDSVREGALAAWQPQKGGEILAAVRNSELLSAIQDGLRRIGAPPARAVPLPEAMARLVGPGRPPLCFLCEPQPECPGWDALHAAAEDPFSPTHILMLGPDDLSDDPVRLLAALRELTGRRESGEAEKVAALRLGLARGELAMRYQPIVRIADRRPVGFEGLVRWLRPDGRRGATAMGPDSFVMMAERGGLAQALARAVGRLAVAETKALRPVLSLPVSINLPLQVLLERDTGAWLGDLCRGERLRREELGVELTETSPVRDPLLLRRAVTRLRQAGHPVWIDDMSLEENRDVLLDLPFTGLKLDRHLVSATRRSRRARAEIERLVALAHERGMLVTAEGVTDAALWQAVARAGADHVQGFAVGRPLPAAALPAWATAWRGMRRPLGRVDD